MPEGLRRVVVVSTFVAAMPVISGCGGGSVESERNLSEQHVWQDEVDTIDKARGVEETLKDAAGAREAERP